MALNEDYVHDSSKLLSKRIILVSSLLTVAADEYAIGIVNKNVENKFEYQDALGFTIVAKNILNINAAATPQAIIFFLLSGAKLAAIRPIMIALSAAITTSIIKICVVMNNCSNIRLIVVYKFIKLF